MSGKFPEQRGAMANRESGFAAQGEMSPEDQTLMETAMAEATRDPSDLPAGSLEADDALSTDVGTVPASEVTAIHETSGYEETVDGLDDTEETVRQQAEDRATGDNEDYQT